MSRKPSSRARSRRFVLLAGAGVFAAAANAESTCYDTWGQRDDSLQPCFEPGSSDASGAAWCCGKNDSCLSNGLCLSHDSSNLMTQQGCTDEDWGGSCTRFCSASNVEQTTHHIALIPCPASFDSATNNVQFCCGPDPASCCENSISWTTVPPGTVIRPPTSGASSASPSQTGSTSYARKIGLGIGLGLGVPILLVLLAVAYLLLQQPLRSRRTSHRRRRRRRNGTTTQTTNRHEPAPTEKSSSSTTASYPRLPRGFGGGGFGSGRKSFGHHDDASDANDNGAGWPHPPHDPHAWPTPVSAGGKSLAAVVATWARSPFGFGGLQPPGESHHRHRHPGTGTGMGQGVPESPKEMEAQGMAGIMGMGGGGGGRWPGRAELDSEGAAGGGGECRGQFSESAESLAIGGGGRSWTGAKRVYVAGREVELPTPDTPERDVEKGLGR